MCVGKGERKCVIEKGEKHVGESKGRETERDTDHVDE